MNKQLLLLGLWLVVACQPPVKDERPVMTFTLTNGSTLDARELDDRMMLILFQPDCDHCQDEATQIQKRLEAFDDYQLYFISSYPMEQIDQFAKTYQLANIPNIHFGSTSPQSVLNNYGPIPAPSVYIYTKQGKLVKSFEGPIDVEMIIKHL